MSLFSLHFRKINFSLLCRRLKCVLIISKKLLIIFSSSSSTVDAIETEKFSLSLREWWDDRKGPAAALHSMNTVRVPLIKEALIGTRDEGGEMGPHPLNGFKILDVGCGGGILCEVSHTQF